MFEHHKSIFVSFFLILLALAPASAFAQSAAKAPSSPAVKSQWMVGLFSDGAKALRAKAREANERAGQVQSSLTVETKQLRQLRLKIAMVKTAMEVKTISSPIVVQILNTYSAQEAQLSSEANSLGSEIEGVTKRRAKASASQAAIEAQAKILKSAKAPRVWSKQIDQAYGQYEDAQTALAAATNELLNVLTQKLQLIKQQKDLIDEVLPRLTNLQQTFMAELLQRGHAKSFWLQLGALLENIGALPGRAWKWSTGLLRSGRIQEFLLKRLAPLTGLLFLIAFLLWVTKHVKSSLELLMKRIHQADREIGVRLLISLTRSLIALVHPIAFMIWLTLVYSILGLFGSTAPLILLYTLAGLLVLAILIRMVTNLFCVTQTGKCGIHQIKVEKARSLSLHLKIYLTYVVMGFVATEILSMADFPLTVKLFSSYLYEIGVLLWTCVLLRPGYLKNIIARAPSRARERWLRTLWSALLLMLVFVLFVELLGFQSLSTYVINATVLTEAILAGVLLFGALGMGILKEVFERENVFFKNHKAASVRLKEFYLPLRLVFSLALTAGLITGLLWAWGIGFKSVTVFVDHLSRGVKLGSLHLSPLNVLIATFVLYLVFRGSSLARRFLRERVFPRTGWDLGIQYSIAAILQYAIIVAGVLLAMNILGFPLASLALLAGAMGIGAGLGLQHVIANFVSGLVLLFERPIKVGDMLVVDGQWGEVKAIQMRSTIFQTFDRYVLIIPNSDLLSGKIVNWTHYGVGPNRLTLKVGVAYSSDVKVVTELLQEICSANPRVLNDPPPQIYFQAYGDSSLDFNIWVFVRVPADRIPATHEINTAIFEVFREKGIEIPFPQRDLHIKDERKPASE